MDIFELTNFKQLVLSNYSEAEIEEDNNSISYEQAYKEAHHLDEIKKQEQMAF